MCCILIALISLSCCAADTGSQKIFFDFGTKKVEFKVPIDSIWKPHKVDDQVDEKGAFYYKPTWEYNLFAMELFKNLVDKKTTEEVMQFWKDFFQLKFNDDDVNFANAKDGLLDLVDSTRAQDVLLAGLIVITVPRNSIWRIKTINNLRGLLNGDVLYYIFDKQYNPVSIALFRILITKKTNKEVAQFWEGFFDIDKAQDDIKQFVSGMSLDSKNIVHKNLLNLVYDTGSREIFLPNDQYKLQFNRNDKVFGLVPITQGQISKFNYFNSMLGELGVDRVIPVFLTENIDPQHVVENFELLLKRISLSQALNVEDEVFNVIDDMSLYKMQQIILLGQYLSLQQPYLNSLIDAYVNKLIMNNFDKPNQVLKFLPSNLDIDTVVVQALMQKILVTKYPSDIESEIIPRELKSVIESINQTEKALRGKETRQASLTLDLLYFMAHKYPDMVRSSDNIKKLKSSVSIPMQFVVHPTLWKKAQSAYFSLTDAFKRRFTLFAGATAAIGAVGLAGWLWSKYGRSGAMPSVLPTQQSAVTGKLLPMGAR